jgi:hypothetical protein
MNSLKDSRRWKWFWLLLLVLIIAIKLWSVSHDRVEVFYSKYFYYYLSVSLRFLFGWIPVSIGDILYLIAGAWLFWKVIKNLRLLFQKRYSFELFKRKLWRLLVLFAGIYIIFNIFWGLNYDRRGIGWQLHLPVVSYDSANLKLMQSLLLQKVNETKKILLQENITYPGRKELFARAKICYDSATTKYPFLKYKILSVKPSLYGYLGDYLGFTGYYNPFTGEAQVNTTVPKFLLPYVALHEMGHQLGYAKEDEANFSGYLAAANSHDTLFQYSAYLDLFVYANREVFYFDSTASKQAAMQLIPEVKTDLHEWKLFNRKYRNVFEPAISWLYGKYLQANQQPKGLGSYNEVIAALLAYYKKFGRI